QRRQPLRRPRRVPHDVHRHLHPGQCGAHRRLGLGGELLGHGAARGREGHVDLDAVVLGPHVVDEAERDDVEAQLGVPDVAERGERRFAPGLGLRGGGVRVDHGDLLGAVSPPARTARRGPVARLAVTSTPAAATVAPPTASTSRDAAATPATASRYPAAATASVRRAVGRWSRSANIRGRPDRPVVRARARSAVYEMNGTILWTWRITARPSHAARAATSAATRRVRVGVSTGSRAAAAPNARARTRNAAEANRNPCSSSRGRRRCRTTWTSDTRWQTSPAPTASPPGHATAGAANSSPAASSGTPVPTSPTAHAPSRARGRWASRNIGHSFSATAT